MCKDLELLHLTIGVDIPQYCPRIKSGAVSAHGFRDITCQHQLDWDFYWFKDTHRELLKALRIESEGLTGQKGDFTAILAQILKQANIKNIFLMGSDVPGDLSLHKLWHKAWVTRLAFICFHPWGEAVRQQYGDPENP